MTIISVHVFISWLTVNYFTWNVRVSGVVFQGHLSLKEQNARCADEHLKETLSIT